MRGKEKKLKEKEMYRENVYVHDAYSRVHE